MRSDMAKVIVERPRFGSRIKGKPKGLRRRQQRLGHEGMPRREGMKRRCNGNCKSLNEHLGPLRRYLMAQVGRPWDKVFADICRHINRNSAVQDHVRDHVDDYVIVHALSTRPRSSCSQTQTLPRDNGGSLGVAWAEYLEGCSLTAHQSSLRPW
jgi:hypothetical protein